MRLLSGESLHQSTITITIRGTCVRLNPTSVTTKKLLVAHDESKPDAGSGDFLVVVFDGVSPRFLGLCSREFFSSGRMVYVGKEINAKDLFAKLVDTGRRIESVERTLNTLEAYVQQLQGFRIGNVLTVEADVASGFKLVKLADAPSRINVSKLP